ncbi:hypothetical protein Q7P35_009232 [Cladosporium inversicolor]
MPQETGQRIKKQWSGGCMHGEAGRFFGELCTRERPDEQFGPVRDRVSTYNYQPVAISGRQRDARSPDGRTGETSMKRRPKTAAMQTQPPSARHITPQHTHVWFAVTPCECRARKAERSRRNDSAVCNGAKLSESSPRLGDFHAAVSRPWLTCETGAMRDSDIAPVACGVPALAAGLHCESSQASRMREMVNDISRP